MENEKEIPYGKCHCKCNGDAPIAKWNDKRRGNTKGEPQRFIQGHGRKIFISPDITAPLCACGCGKRTKLCTHGRVKDGHIHGEYYKYCTGHKAKKPPKPINEKHFWSKVDIGKENECWEWKGYTDRLGYGAVSNNRTMLYAHRVAFILSGGILTEEKKHVCHHCDNPSCCNPQHLFAGSLKDNAEDRERKGRGNHGIGENSNVAKLTNNDVLTIRYNYINGINTRKELAIIYNIDVSTIHLIVNRKTWAHI